MSEPDSRIRPLLIVYFPMFIATLSLATSIFNGYLNNRFLDYIERNTSRVEYMKTCKEIIDAYYQIKARARALNANGARAGETADGTETVMKFAALGTYLANLRDDTIRQRYTQLTEELEKAMQQAARVPPGDLNKLFEPADRIFAEMNDDCVRSAKDAPM
jgi:hypothetical protein